MAKPKEPAGQISSAFHDRCMKERLRLTHKLARQLRLDMQGLLEDDTHADLTLIIPDDDEIMVHRAILRQRAPWFFHDFLGSPAPGSKNIDHADVPSLIHVIRDIYTNNNLSHSKHIVQKWCEISDHNSNIPTIPHQNANHSHPSTDADSDISPHDAEYGLGDWSGTPEMGSTPVDEFRFGHSKIEAISSPDEDLEFDVQVAMHAASVCHNGDGTEKLKGCCSLGDDMLELLESGTDADVEIHVQGKVLPAHKCILCVRSSYFSAMLGGSWRESSDGHKVNLEGVSAAVLEHCLRYMYGGVVSLSPGCSLPELVATADMYAIEGLKDVAEFILRMEHCHFFHKPCAGCLVGVADTLALAAMYGMTELEKKCLQWSNKHFVRLWPTKSFASLPQELLDNCCWALTDELSTTNVMERLMDCDRLTGSLPQVKWAEPLTVLTNQVMEACIGFLSRHLVEIINRKTFLEMETTMALSMSFFEDVFGKAIMQLPADRACATYMACKKLETYPEEVEDCSWTEDFKKFVKTIYEKCEKYMNLHINQIVGSDGWKDLPPDIQKFIKEGAWYVSVSDAKSKTLPPRLQNPGSVSARNIKSRQPPEAKPAKSQSSASPPRPRRSTAAARGAASPLAGAKTTSTTARTTAPRTPKSSSAPTSHPLPSSSRTSRTEPRPSTSKSSVKSATAEARQVPATASSHKLKTPNPGARAGACGIPFVPKSKSSWSTTRKSSSTSSGACSGSSRKSSSGSGPQDTSLKSRESLVLRPQELLEMASEVAVNGNHRITSQINANDICDDNDNVQMGDGEQNKSGLDDEANTVYVDASSASNSPRSIIEKENANNEKARKTPRSKSPAKSTSRPSSGKSGIPRTPSKRTSSAASSDEKLTGLSRAERIAARQAQIESDREKGLIPQTRWSPKPQEKPNSKSALSPASRGRAEVERTRIAQTEAWAKAQRKQIGSNSHTYTQSNKRDLKDLLDKGAGPRMKKRLREDDDISLCSQRAVRGSIATPFDMTPSDFGSEGPSELFDASDIYSRANSVGTNSLTQPSSSVDDGYSSNKTIDSDFEPPSPRHFPADPFIPFLIFDFLIPDEEEPGRS